MNPERPTYCKKCGASLPTDADFCESCGSPVGTAASGAEMPAPPVDAVPVVPAVQSESFHPGAPAPIPAPAPARPKLEDFRATIELPDTSVPPRVGRALSVGWDILWNDPLGAILVAIIFTIMMIVVNTIPLVNMFLIIALTVGVFAWAEERRRKMVSNPGTMFRVAIDRFPDSLLLGLVNLLLGALFALPIVIIYISFIFWIFSVVFAGISGAQSGQFPLWGQLSTVAFMTLIFWGAVFLLVTGPVLSSLMALASWAISIGKPFSESFMWAWERIKRNFFGWWWAGIAISFMSGIGALFCYVGVFVTMPWAYLAWAELCGDTGEESAASTK